MGSQHVRLGNEPWLDEGEHKFFQRPCPWLRQTRRDIKKTKDDPAAIASLINEWKEEGQAHELYRWCRKWVDGQTDAVLEKRERKAGRALKAVPQSPRRVPDPQWMPAFMEALTEGEWATYQLHIESGLSSRQAAAELNVSQTLIQKRTAKLPGKLWATLEATAPGANALKVMESIAIDEIMGTERSTSYGPEWCCRRHALPDTPCRSRDAERLLTPSDFPRGVHRTTSGEGGTEATV
jgi:hypothetical protein